MSDTTSSGISRATVPFVVLLLALGALILASNSISPQSTIRPGEIAFVNWKSADGHIELARPSEWLPQQDGPKNYAFGSDSQSTITPSLRVLHIQIVDENTLKEVVRTEASTWPSEVQQSFKSQMLQNGFVQHFQVAETTYPGKTQPLDIEVWAVKIDDNTALFATWRSTQYEAAKPLIDRMMHSIKVDGNALEGVLEVMPTLEATLPANPETTAESTASAAMSEPTLEPTAAATAS